MENLWFLRPCAHYSVKAALAGNEIFDAMDAEDFAEDKEFFGKGPRRPRHAFFFCGAGGLGRRAAAAADASTEETCIILKETRHVM